MSTTISAAVLMSGPAGIGMAISLRCGDLLAHREQAGELAALGKKLVRRALGDAAGESAVDQIEIEPCLRMRVEKCDRVVVRCHDAGVPAIEKPRRVEERADIRLERRIVERGKRVDARDLLAIGRERLAAQIDAHVIEARPRRHDALALIERPRMIEIIEPIERRKATDGEAAIGPEKRQLRRKFRRALARMGAIASISAWLSPSSATSPISISL